MSFVNAQPEALTAAADTLSSTGLTLASLNEATQVPISSVVPPSADEVSAMVSARFIAQAQLYHGVSAEATAIHEMFVATLNASASTYEAAEAANAIAAG